MSMVPRAATIFRFLEPMVQPPPPLSVGILDTGHDVGIADQFLTGRAADGALHIAVSQFLSHCPLGLCHRFCPRRSLRPLS